jgi:hypothetical protein
LEESFWMGSRKYFFKDPSWSEYVFHCLRTCPVENKMDLSTEELWNIRSETAMRRFADYANLDKQLYLLARIGISFCLLSGPVDSRLQDVLDAVQVQFEKTSNRSDVVKLMSEQKFFGLSSRDILPLGHMAAQNSHSQVYVLDMAYMKLRENLNEAGEDMLNRQIEESKRSLGYIAEFSLQAINGYNKCEAICGVAEFELKLLLAIYKHRNTFVTHATICALVDESFRTKIVALACSKLERNGYLERMLTVKTLKDKHNQTFTITEKGINTVLTFVRYVTKKMQ